MTGWGNTSTEHNNDNHAGGDARFALVAHATRSLVVMVAFCRHVAGTKFNTVGNWTLGDAQCADVLQRIMSLRPDNVLTSPVRRNDEVRQCVHDATRSLWRSLWLLLATSGHHLRSRASTVSYSLLHAASISGVLLCLSVAPISARESMRAYTSHLANTHTHTRTRTRTCTRTRTRTCNVYVSI